MPVPFHYIGASGGTPRPDDLLFQVVGTDRAAVPVPLMTTTQKNALAGMEEGDWVFDITLNAPSYYSGAAWVEVYGSGTWQPLDADLTAIATLNSTGFARQAGAGTWSIVGETGSGSVVRATSPTIVTPTIAKLANLTSDGFVTTSAGDGTLVVVPAKQVLLGNGNNGTVGASTTRWTAPGGVLISATEANAAPKVAFAFTAKNLYIRVAGTQDASGNLVFTIRKNGVDTALTATLAAGGTSTILSDTSNSVAFAAGDIIDLQIANNATATSLNIHWWTLEMDTVA